jgi:sialic acid synthase SpsE
MAIGNNYFSNLDRCYLIAEIGVNHNGDMTLARAMIDAAKLAGADAVKFQTFNADMLVTPNTPKVLYQQSTTAPNESHYEMIKKLELGFEEHILLSEYCSEVKIDFLSTPYDVNSAQFLHEKLNVQIFKTASADIVDLSLQRYIASTGKPSIVALGMATLAEVEQVFEVYESEKNSNLIFLHCVSNYPCSDNSINLAVMKTIQQAFQVPVGYSDHSVGNSAAILSIAFGAKVIEKHFTLDKNLPGPDHLASSTPDEFFALASEVRRAEKMIGSPIKRCQAEERQMSEVSRKSIVLARDLNVGDELDFECLTLKRPGTGLSSQHLNYFFGKKINKKMDAGAQIFFEDVS